MEKTRPGKVQILNKTYSLVGRRWIRLEMVDSTNSWILQNPHLLEEDRLIVTADRQVKGRGKGERIWECGIHGNLICSIVIHPPLPRELLPSTTLIVGLGIFDALSDFSIEGLSLKWPNDVMLDGKKVCGILCELVFLEKQSVVVTGIGLNLVGGKDQFSSCLYGKTTTVEEATGLRLDRFLVLERIISCIDSLLNQASREGLKGILQRWEHSSCSMGKRLVFMEHGSKMNGIFSGLGPLGRAIAKTEDGKMWQVVSGEIEN